MTEDQRQFSKVLRRYDRSIQFPIRYNSYDVSLRSEPFELNGVVALTLFFPIGKEKSAKRATKLGWIDETEEYMSEVLGVKTQESDNSDIEKMSWHQIRKYAASLGLDLSGKREDIEHRILEVRRG